MQSTLQIQKSFWSAIHLSFNQFFGLGIIALQPALHSNSWIGVRSGVLLHSNPFYTSLFTPNLVPFLESEVDCSTVLHSNLRFTPNSDTWAFTCQPSPCLQLHVSRYEMQTGYWASLGAWSVCAAIQCGTPTPGVQPHGVPFNTPLQLALRNPVVECDLNPQSKIAWIFGVTHSAECHSKSRPL